MPDNHAHSDSPTLEPSVSSQLLAEQIVQGRELLKMRPISEDNLARWTLLTRNLLERAFGASSSNVSSVVSVGSFGPFPPQASEQWWEKHRAATLASQLARMEALVELLVTESQLREVGFASVSSESYGHKVFLVHGHDEGAAQSVARFLERLNQKVTILREQPNGGRTIIEKFEEQSDVGFAVVLLTADDLGRAKDDDVGALRPRARQNVLLEMGFFIGRLGRARVCALHRAGVEIPSDYSGVLYITLDAANAWQLLLARELKAANLPIDMNKAL